MVKVRIFRDPDGLINGFSLTGHAGYAPAGEDIVCAAISALAQTIIGSLIDIVGIKPTYTLASGGITCVIPAPDSLNQKRRLQVKTLMEAFELGCEQIYRSEDEKGSYSKWLEIERITR